MSKRNALYSLKLSKIDLIFEDLIREITVNDAPISGYLHRQISNLTIDERRELMKKKRDGSTALFLACKRGNCDQVEYLVKYGSDLEQTCLYEEPGDPVVHYVPPLWCASVRGHLKVVKLLVRLGANINSQSNTGSSCLSSACFLNYVDIVMFLVEHGANVNKPSHDGGTCLMNSVKSVQLCRYLIQKGANINAKDVKDKSSLHYAIKELRLETVMLLIEKGANPFDENCHGDDALQTICLRGDQNLFDYLTNVIYYPPERLANARELLGSTFLDEYQPWTIMNWRMAHFIRTCQPKIIKKQPVIRREAYGHMTEFNSIDELDAISTDVDKMRIQSLLICERVLGLSHKETLYRLMCQGASYAEYLQYQRCLDIWKLCLETRIDKLSILNCKTCMTAEAVIRLMLDLTYNEDMVNNQDKAPKFSDILDIFELLVKNMKECRKWLTIRPVFKKQQQNFDRIFKCICHLIYLMIVKTETEEQKKQVQESVTRLIQSNIRSAGTNDSLLHLSLSRLNYIKNVIVTFPNYEVVKLLLECGIEVNALNESKSTPLHIATTPYNFDNKIIKLLLENGGHVDLPNKLKDRPCDYIVINPSSGISLTGYTTLKCLAATVVVRYKIPYKNQIPLTLERFVKHHES